MYPLRTHTTLIATKCWVQLALVGNFLACGLRTTTIIASQSCHHGSLHHTMEATIQVNNGDQSISESTPVTIACFDPKTHISCNQLSAATSLTDISPKHRNKGEGGRYKHFQTEGEMIATQFWLKGSWTNVAFQLWPRLTCRGSFRSRRSIWVYLLRPSLRPLKRTFTMILSVSSTIHRWVRQFLSSFDVSHASCRNCNTTRELWIDWFHYLDCRNVSFAPHPSAGIGIWKMLLSNNIVAGRAGTMPPSSFTTVPMRCGE